MMRRLPRFDLLAPAPRPWAGWVALAASLAVLGATLAALHPLAGGTSSMAAAPPAPPAGPNGTVVASPWNDYFALQADHGDGRVRLLQITPGAQAGQVALLGQAPDLGSMLAWLARLQADTRLADVRLLHHERDEALLKAQVRFTVEARWRDSHRDGVHDAVHDAVQAGDAGAVTPRPPATAHGRLG